MKKKKVFVVLSGVILLFVGYAIGAGINSIVYSSPVNDPLAEPIVRHSSAMRRVEKSQMAGENPVRVKVFSDKELVRFLSRLEKVTSSSQLKKELEYLMEYPCRDENVSHQLAIQLLLSRWGELAPQEALVTVRQLDGIWGVLKNRYSVLILNSWMARDPEAVAKYCLEKENVSLMRNQMVLSRIGEEFTKKSPDQAWEWISTLRNRVQKDVLQSFFYTVLETCPERTEEFMNKLTHGVALEEELNENDRALLYNLTSMWEGKDSEAVLAWLSKLPESWRDLGLSYYVESLGRRDFMMALNFLPELSEQQRRNVVRDMAGSVFSSGDVDRIDAWEKEVENRGLLKEILPKAYFLARSLNSCLAGDVFSKLREGEFRDSLAMAYIERDCEPDYGKLRKIAESIQDEKVRKKAIQRVEDHARQAAIEL